jgi:uncharacterized coiled-coil DUF342 family protein
MHIGEKSMKIIRLLLVLGLLVTPVKEILAGNHNEDTSSSEEDINCTNEDTSRSEEDINCTEEIQRVQQTIEELRRQDEEWTAWRAGYEEQRTELQNKLNSIAQRSSSIKSSIEELAQYLQEIKSLKELQEIYAAVFANYNEDINEKSNDTQTQILEARNELEEQRGYIDYIERQRSWRSSCNVC